MDKIERLKSFRLESIFILESSLRKDDELFKELFNDLEEYRDAIKGMDPSDKAKSWESSFNIVTYQRNLINKLKRLSKDNEIANQSLIVMRAASRIEDMRVKGEDSSVYEEELRNYVGV